MIVEMGGLTGVMGMLPSVKKAQAQMAAANVDDKMVVHQEAIIGSMTVTERKKPDLIKASRKRRIAAGSGTTVQDVNKLLKQYQEMTRMMKKMRKMKIIGSHVPRMESQREPSASFSSVISMPRWMSAAR